MGPDIPVLSVPYLARSWTIHIDGGIAFSPAVRTLLVRSGLACASYVLSLGESGESLLQTACVTLVYLYLLVSVPPLPTSFELWLRCVRCRSAAGVLRSVRRHLRVHDHAWSRHTTFQV